MQVQILSSSTPSDRFIGALTCWPASSQLDRIPRATNVRAHMRYIVVRPIEESGEERSTENFMHGHVRGCFYFYKFKAVKRSIACCLSSARGLAGCQVRRTFYLLCLLACLSVPIMYSTAYTARAARRFFRASFSAPNYLDVYINKAATVKCLPLSNISLYSYSPHRMSEPGAERFSMSPFPTPAGCTL